MNWMVQPICKAAFQCQLLIFVMLAPSAAFCAGPSVFVTSDGSPSGACQTDVHTPMWFNDPKNWGAGQGQIGAGTTVLICGTFIDATQGDTLLNVQGSGSAGNPITLLFDANASLTSTAYWGVANNGKSAIYLGGQNYITVDGGTNGLIQNTANGTGLAYDNPTSGIGSAGGHDITIKNLTIANMCQHTSVSDTTGCAVSGSGSYGVMSILSWNVTIQNVNVHDAQACIAVQVPSGAVNLVVDKNTVSRCSWGIVIYSQAGTASTISVTRNDISNLDNWDTTTDVFHHDGIFVFTVGTGGITNVIEANNYFHGAITQAPGGINCSTAWIYNSNGTLVESNFMIYNNFFTFSDAFGPSNGMIKGVPSSSQVFNNTFLGNGIGKAIDISGTNSNTNSTIENNVLANMNQFIAINSPVTLVDYNQYMSVVPRCDPWLYGGGPCYGQSTFAAWQTACSCDADGAYYASNTVNPNGTLQAASPAIRGGANLTSLGIAGLEIDAAGVARPATGPWDIGAYQHLPPDPPTGLRALVK